MKDFLYTASQKLREKRVKCVHFTKANQRRQNHFENMSSIVTYLRFYFPTKRKQNLTI